MYPHRDGNRAFLGLLQELQGITVSEFVANFNESQRFFNERIECRISMLSVQVEQELNVVYRSDISLILSFRNYTCFAESANLERAE